ncbi:MAG: CO dehydrogenase/CO-methylating acetyl-CoA synthase complex subunit beta [Candidatus Hydrothermarchaeota archaeon]
MAEEITADVFPFDMSPMYEGERIRGEDMYVELAGPKGIGFELVQAASMDEIEDYRVTLIGPDLEDMEEGGRYPFAMIYKVAGEMVEKDLESVIERRNHEFQNFIQGYMHLNQRYDIWIRISKDAIKKGLKSLKQIAQATMFLFKQELPFIEKIEAIYITDKDEVEKRMPEAMKAYEERDARTRELSEEDVDTFYGCTLCQSFAPTNVCVITPDRVSLCGAMTWFDGRAAAKVDPEGPMKVIPKGELLNAEVGEYSGVNEAAVTLSGGEYDRIWLHSFMQYPHTSCGCFEVIGFYIPEVDGFGWVHRDFKGVTVNGLPFSTMAGQTGGGKQVPGFLGIGIEYFRSPKFLMADGGWSKTVWLPKALKDRVQDAIPEDLVDKIATEEDVKDIEELKAFLKERGHPVVASWVEEVPEEVPPEEAPAPEAPPTPTPGVTPMPEMQVTAPSMPTVPAGMPIAGGTIRLVLKGAKIHIDKVIVKRETK